MASKNRRAKYDEIQEAGYGYGRGSMKVEHLSIEEHQLLEAVRLKQTKKYKRLLDTGVNPNIKDEAGGNSPLHYAAQAAREEEGLSDMLVTLLHCGADPNATDCKGRTALHLAVHSNSANVQALLDAGAFIDAQDLEGCTPLMTLMRNTFDRVVADVTQQLADRGCNVHLRCSSGCTALHILCWNWGLSQARRCSVARILLGIGLSATAEDRSGRQPICYELERVDAFGQGWTEEHLGLVRLLIQAGSTLNLGKKKHRDMVQSCLNFMEATYNWLLLRMAAPALPLSTLARLPDFMSTTANSLGHPKDMRRYALERARTVPPLKACCRQTLRELFRGKVLYRTQTLSVPEAVKNYICNLDDYFVFVPSEEQ